MYTNIIKISSKEHFTHMHMHPFHHFTEMDACMCNQIFATEEKRPPPPPPLNLVYIYTQNIGRGADLHV